MMQVQLAGMDGFGLNKSSQLCYQWANVEGEHWNFYIKVRATLKHGIRNPESEPETGTGIRNLENKMGKTKESKFFKSEILGCLVCF